MILRKTLMLRVALLLLLATATGVLYAAEGDIYTLLDDSNLRQGPDSSFASTGVVREGDDAVALKIDGSWVKVRVPASGDVGWLYVDSLERKLATPAADQGVTVSKPAEQTASAPDVVVSNGLSDAATKTHAKNGSQAKLQQKPQQVQSVAPLFEDGVISQQAAPVEQQPVEVTRPSVAVAHGLENQTASRHETDHAVKQPAAIAGGQVEEHAAAVASLAQPEVTPQAQETTEISKQATPDVEPASTEKVVGIGKHQRVVETTSLDQEVNTAELREAAIDVHAKNAQQANHPQQVESEQKPEQSEPVTPHEDGVVSQQQAASVEQKVAEATQPVVSDTPPAPTMGAADSVGSMQQVIATTTIRTGPGDADDILGWVGKGARVRAVERQGDWWKVSIPDGGKSGWMKASVLQPLGTGHVDAVSVASKVQPGQAIDKTQDSAGISEAEVAANTEEAVSFVKAANLRAGPDRHFDVVAWAGQGSYAKKLDRKGDWLRVQLQQSGRIGWVYYALVKQAHTAGALVMATPLSDQVTEASAIATSATETGAAMKVAADQAGSAPKQAQHNLVSQPSVRAVQPEAPQIAKVAALQPVKAENSDAGSNGHNLFSFDRKANLRAGPDVKFDVISWAGIGSYAYELDRKGDWVRVQMQVSKRIGWVYHRSLKLVKAGMPLPVGTVKAGQVAEQPVAQLSRIMAKTAPDGLFIFKQTTNLRAGPGKQYEVVAWGGKHEAAKVLKQKGDWRRVQMSISGKKGWVFNTALVRAGTGHAIAAAIASEHKPEIKMYQALRTEPLRADAMKFSELTGWVGKDESVALVEQREGWMRVQPQGEGKKAGWIEANKLRPTSEIQPVVNIKKELRTVTYQDRISKGEAFNFSYAALESALYRVPVEDISVRIGKDDLKAMFRKDTYDKSSFEIRLRSGRHHLAGRIKVLGSSTRVFKKKSLLIKLDKESSHWYGRRRIALRSMATDKALMREWIAWKLLAAMGMKVPEVHFTRISFNHGEKTGLYLNIEWLGKQFLQENNLEVNGGFYQPNDASHCGDLNSSENMELCFDKLSPQDDDFSMLSAMAKAVSTASADDMDRILAKYFNQDSVINWIVGNALVTNGDTYNKNYWLHYSTASHKWTLIPWDYNLTFGRVYDPFGVKPFKIFNDNFQYYFPIDVGASNPLKDKLVRNPKLRAQLETRLKHLLGLQPNGPEETFGWFSPTVMQARIGNLAAVVGKEVYKDTFLTFGEGDFTKTYESLMHYVTEHDHYLKAKLQGSYRWQPSPPFDPSQGPVLEPLPKALYGEGSIDAGGQSIHLTDHGWGYFVARLSLGEPLKKKAKFKVRVEGAKTPKYLPIAQSPGRCVRRSWVVTTVTPGIAANGNLMVEYVQENSRRTEVPVTLHEELLELWVRDGSHWRPLKTEVNEYANTLIASGVHVESGHIQRFVACSPF